MKLGRRPAPLPMDELAEKYLAGASTGALALTYGVARSTVNIRLKAHGVQLRKPGYPASRPVIVPPLKPIHRRGRTSVT